MGYKLLITGKNNLIIDEFFDHILGPDMDMVTTSLRYRDMVNHLTMYQPDLFVYCLYNESNDDIKRLCEFKRQLSRENVPVCIIGSHEECEDMQARTGAIAELLIEKPITAEKIKAEIIDYLTQLEEIEEETRRIQAAMAQKAEEDRRKHVLVIDDDPRQLNVIKEYLYEKYEIATAISGKIAYRFLEKKKTDLILLDYEMPGENGPEVLTKLRELGLIDGVPVLFLTGTTDKDKIKTALLLKPQGYLLKPIDKEKLMGNLERFIG